MHKAVQKRIRNAAQVRNILDNEKASIISFITGCNTPVYVNTVVNHFGKNSEEKDVYRTSVWNMIASSEIHMCNTLRLTVGNVNV